MTKKKNMFVHWNCIILLTDKPNSTKNTFKF